MFALQRNQVALCCFLGHCSGTPLWVNEDFPVTSLVEGLLGTEVHRGRGKWLENQLQAAGDPQAVLPAIPRCRAGACAGFAGEGVVIGTDVECIWEMSLDVFSDSHVFPQ